MYKLISIYFFIGFISDVVLNYFSRQTYVPVPASIKALKVYFLRSSIKNSLIRDLVSAINAGLTIVAAIILTMSLSYLIFQFAHPRTLAQLFRFLPIAFAVGYVMDVFIYKTELFGPTLNPFYKIAGAGFWGAMAFIFAILIYVFIDYYSLSI
jgi:hypothetical protein